MEDLSTCSPENLIVYSLSAREIEKTVRNALEEYVFPNPKLILKMRHSIDSSEEAFAIYSQSAAAEISFIFQFQEDADGGLIKTSYLSYTFPEATGIEPVINGTFEVEEDVWKYLNQTFGIFETPKVVNSKPDLQTKV